MGLSAVGLGLLAVPADAWPDGSRVVVGGVIAGLTVLGAVPLWAFARDEMLGRRGRLLRANHMGVDVIDSRFRRAAMLSPAAGRTPGYVFARWSDVQTVHVDGAFIGLTTARGTVPFAVDGLTQAERAWLVARLQQLADRVPSRGEVPPALVRLTAHEGP